MFTSIDSFLNNFLLQKGRFASKNPDTFHIFYFIVHNRKRLLLFPFAFILHPSLALKSPMIKLVLLMSVYLYYLDIINLCSKREGYEFFCMFFLHMLSEIF